MHVRYVIMPVAYLQEGVLGGHRSQLHVGVASVFDLREVDLLNSLDYLNCLRLPHLLHKLRLGDLLRNGGCTMVVSL